MADLRLMTAADSTWARAQMARERWSSYAGWIHTHLTHDPDGCFVAEIDGEPVGLVTSTAFGRTGWLGNLIVAPEHRRSGVGTQLMEAGLARLHDTGLEVVRIDADPPGMGIYRRLGFVERYDSLRFWSREVRPHAHPGVRPMGASDLEVVAAFDAPRFGDNRGRFLRILTDVCAHALVLEEGGELAGFIFVIPTQDGFQLGPTVALGIGAARALIETAAHAAGPVALVTGLPATNAGGCSLLRGLGFTEASPSRRMVHGDPEQITEDVGSIFALASGACG